MTKHISNALLQSLEAASNTKGDHHQSEANRLANGFQSGNLPIEEVRRFLHLGNRHLHLRIPFRIMANTLVRPSVYIISYF